MAWHHHISYARRAHHGAASAKYHSINKGKLGKKKKRKRKQKENMYVNKREEEKQPAYNIEKPDNGMKIIITRIAPYHI